MGTVIGITAAKGGIGKSTVLVNLATAMAHEGKKVLAVDMCMKNGSLSLLLGLENRVAYSVIDVLEGNAKIVEALVRADEFGGLFLLPAAAYQDFPSAYSQKLLKLFAVFKREFDYVFVDFPDETAISGVVSLAADSMIFVTGNDSLSVRNTRRAALLLNQEAREKTSVILNRVEVDLVRQAEMPALEDSVTAVGLSLLGAVPEDTDLLLQTETHRPVYGSGTLVSEIFGRIAKRLLGERIPVSLRDDRRMR